MARTLRTWAINRRVENLVRNLRYRPRTRLVTGINNDNNNNNDNDNNDKYLRKKHPSRKYVIFRADLHKKHAQHVEKKCLGKE